MEFQYEPCTNWLNGKALSLRSLGLDIEVNENTAPVRSFLLKAASSKNEAELVVWETGTASMIVFNLSKNNYDLDRHDLVLNGDHFESELDVFFRFLE
jgi:hypothetical protein